MKRPAALAALALLAACGPAIDRVEIRPRQAILESAGATLQLEATPRDPAGAPLALALRWTSTATDVASVDARGKVTAHRTGEAAVRAEVSGVAAETRIRVSIPVRATMDPPELELVGVPSQGELVLRLQDATGSPVQARQTAWRSLDTAVVRVAGGKVIAVGPGTASVTAGDSGLGAAAKVTVRLPEFARIAARPARLALAAGREGRIEAAALDGAGRPVAGVPLTFTSSDARVATVTADGTVTAVKAGRTQVRVAAGGKSASVAVTVRK